MRLWTIGYERLLPEELVAELGAAGVQRVIDVRFRPQSRRAGMSKTRLEADPVGCHRSVLAHCLQRRTGNLVITDL